MRYKGSFKDVNDKEYLVEIVTNNDMTTETDIILGTPPFTVSYESGDNTIYKPIKYSSATCTIITTNYFEDIYTGANQGTKISLLDNSTKQYKFVGYITPNVYNQSYDGVDQPLELECVDGLSTLKNIDYTTIGEKKDIVSFIDVISHILLQADAYSRLYVSNAISKTHKDSFNILDELYISENNFFDEDDQPMKCSEVLEEIARYLNMTIYADGMDIYMIDYDAIVSDDYTEEYICSVLQTKSILSSTQSETKTITADSFRGASGDFSVDNVYNKATVVSDLYSVENVIKDLFDEDNAKVFRYGMQSVYTGAEEGEPDGYVDAIVNNKNHYWKILTHPQLKSYYYELVNNFPNPIDTRIYDYSEFRKFAGATLYQSALGERNGLEIYYPHLYQSPEEAKLEYKDYILLHTNDVYVKEYFDNNIYMPLFRISLTEANIVAGKETYIYISTNATFRNIKRYYIGDKWQGNYKPKIQDNNGFPILPFHIINKNRDKYVKYCDDGTPVWEAGTPTVSNNIPTPNQLKFWVDTDYNKDNPSKSTRANFYDSSLPVLNNIKHTDGFDDLEGVIMKIPEGTNLADVELLFYFPYIHTGETNKFKKIECVFLEDFDVQIVNKSTESTKKNEEENTKYENVIDGNWVEELGEITFKVCTFDNKEMNYSAVYQLVDDKLTYADTLTNTALNQTLRQEEMLIYRIVQQYKNPKIKLNLQLNNDFQLNNKVLYPTQEADKKFIVDALEIDYANDTTAITLIEKI